MDNSCFLNVDNSTLKEAIKTLEKCNTGIVLVVDQKNCLLGTITDGDVRRSLLNGIDLEINISEVMQRKMIFISQKDDSLLLKAELLMIKHGIKQIPVLNDDKKVIDLITEKDLRRSSAGKLPKVIIMAGGLGSRLLPLTEKTPKPMLKLGQKPLLEIVMSNCIRAGLKEFYFAVNYLKEQIIEYFGDGSEWGIKINYIEEKEPLGTAGALQLFPERDEKPILVLNGDVITNLNLSNLINFHYKNSSIATICVREYLETLSYGVVNLENEIVKSIEEKPSYKHYVNAGIYLLNPILLDFIKKGQSLDMPDLLTLAINSNLKVTACPIHEYWLDVGQPETLTKVKSDLQDTI